MTELKSKPPEAGNAAGRFLPLLLLLFLGSGCAALIYEIVWLQLLQLVIGSSAVSLGVLLGTFMGGMCLGSIALPRFISTRRHPLRVYAVLELGIGIFGILLLFFLPQLSKFYAEYAGHGFGAILLRGLICAVCLLPPTILMGGTLPAMARWVQATPRGVSWLGFFYGGNIVGAVFGCLLAGFYLLRVHDMATATYVAAILNVAVALVAFAFAALMPQQQVSPESRATAQLDHAPGHRWVYVTIALSGMCALGSEVVWTRLLSLMIGGTVYTFSIILAVFLVGLGIGSSVGSFVAREIRQPRVALGWCQALLTVAIAWTAFMIGKSIPFWPIDPSLSWSNPWFNFQIDLARCCWAMLPAACLWGASFPLALAAVASREKDTGRLVGRVYAANTVGAIVGALGASLLLIAWRGTQQAQQVMIAMSAVSAVVMFATLILSSPGSSSDGERARFRLQLTGLVSTVVTVLLGIFFVLSVPPTPWELVAHGRYLATKSKSEQGKKLFMGEGMNASVAVTESSDGTRNFHVSGKVEASTDPRDMRLQRMLGHIPALLHPKPRSVLIVGCGAGVTAGSFVVHPEVKKITICEIEPLIPQVVAKHFGKENYNVVTDKRVTIVYDDARNFILTSKEKFDIITSDPIHPWVKGAATLYTKEYFDLCRAHLEPGGLVTQWVPLYESDPAVVKSELATFFGSFPEGTIWSNDDSGRGYDTVALGSVGPLKINVDELQARLERPDQLPVAESLREVGFKSALEIVGTYAGRDQDLRPWLKDAEINRDRNLRLQYLAGMKLNLYQESSIFDAMHDYCKYPEDLFVASPERRLMLQALIGRARQIK